MGDFTEGDVVFELGNVISKWEVLCDRHGGEPHNSFILDINVNEGCLEICIEGSPCSHIGIGRARTFLVKVDAQVAAEPSFIKERVKAIFF